MPTRVAAGGGWVVGGKDPPVEWSGEGNVSGWRIELHPGWEAGDLAWFWPQFCPECPLRDVVSHTPSVQSFPALSLRVCPS